MIKKKKNGIKKRGAALGILFAVLCCLGTALPSSAAGIEERVIKSWIREDAYGDTAGMQTVEIKVTYYAAEYIEALVRSEAEKNLWTRDEEENYKYTLLKTLNLEDRIAFHVEFDTTGVPVYLQPFDRHLKLYAGKEILEPVDYDKRFNFKLQGQRDGMIWFPRYDANTGKDLLEGVKELRLLISSSISIATTTGGGDVRFIWDITGDDPSALRSGTAMNRLEVDRLLKRVEKLQGEKSTLEGQLGAIDKELTEVNQRVDELQSQ